MDFHFFLITIIHRNFISRRNVRNKEIVLVARLKIPCDKLETGDLHYFYMHILSQSFRYISEN